MGRDPEKVRANAARYRDSHRAQIAAYRAENAERARERSARWRGEHPQQVERQRAKWQATRAADWRREYYANDGDVRFKDRVRAALRYAVRTGAVVKPECCSSCGSRSLLHGHHGDYSQPLVVVWLCRDCHATLHRKRGAG